MVNPLSNTHLIHLLPLPALFSTSRLIIPSDISFSSSLPSCPPLPRVLLRSQQLHTCPELSWGMYPHGSPAWSVWVAQFMPWRTNAGFSSCASLTSMVNSSNINVYCFPCCVVPRVCEECGVVREVGEAFPNTPVPAATAPTSNTYTQYISLGHNTKYKAGAQ